MYIYSQCSDCELTGAAYSGAEKEISDLVERHGLPYIPTPMGKGVLPDDHKQCVIAARSKCVSVVSYCIKLLGSCCSLLFMIVLKVILFM